MFYKVSRNFACSIIVLCHHEYSIGICDSSVVDGAAVINFAFDQRISKVGMFCFSEQKESLRFEHCCESVTL